MPRSGAPASRSTFRDYAPEYRDIPVLGILAASVVAQEMLGCAEMHGPAALTAGDEIMEVKNWADFDPQRC